MKRKAKQKKFVFLQNIDPYFTDVLVCVGASLEEAKRFVQKELIRRKLQGVDKL